MQHRILPIVFACFITLSLPVANAQGTRADYDRSAQLAALTRDKVAKAQVHPHWFAQNRRFWYRNDLGQRTYEFVCVDVMTGERQRAFDHRRLATELNKVLKGSFTPEKLPFETIRLSDDVTKLEFTVKRQRFECSLESYQLREVNLTDETINALPMLRAPRPSRGTGEETSLSFTNRTKDAIQLHWLDTEGKRKFYATLEPDQEHEQHTYAGHVWLVTSTSGQTLGAFEATESPGRIVVDGKLRPRETDSQVARHPAASSADSPSGEWTVVARNYNLVLRNRKSGQEFPLSHDGQADDAYSDEIFWAPDSRHVVAMRTQRGDVRKVQIVESSPLDQLQPKLHEFDYLKPGDRVPVSKPHLFEVVERKEIAVSDESFSNPWSIEDVRWQPDSTEFRFVYNQRGHQVLRVVGVNAESGKVRVLIDEHQSTCVDYAHKQFRHDLDATHEIIWMSERDGWNHLYLYDAATGSVKNQITQGDWVVRSVDRVDIERREIWFRASGVDPSQDPYFVHYCRIGFDGSNLVRLTTGNGTHAIEFSPDGEFLVDTYSKVDTPPIIELRRAKDGSLVCELERADWSALLATGWKPPEPFVAKGRDEVTDIHGVIFRPSNFDSRQTYPVIEQIYAGPHGSFVPKRFQSLYSLQMLAELGFIVVQIDGMGTSNRSKAFQNVSYKNLGDGGFPDRIKWMRSAAAKYPEMDLTRVGIYGGSAGGQNALRALLAHPDFYKVGVADCGCHDNRMDKIWWNELWMGWPVGPHYAEQSNVTHAHKLQGKLLLTVGELDRNVDPASTMQVVHALIKADKDFDLLVVPGAGHGIGESPYAARRRQDFFVRHLWSTEPRR